MTTQSSVLVIRKLTFEAAHYLPGHPKCGAIHGHTYYVRNLEVLTNEFVDFAEIKRVFQFVDHTFLVPQSHLEYWYTIDFDVIDAQKALIGITPVPTVENLAAFLANKLKSIPGVEMLRMELYEGPNQGTKIEV